MRKLAFTGIILQPSLTSFMFVFTLSLLVFINTIVNFSGSNDLLFKLLLGSDTSVELLDTTKSTVSSLSDVFLNNPTLNKLLFFSFWFLVGLVVYAIISGAGSSIDAVQKLHEDEQLLHMQKTKLEKEWVLKLALRATALFAWIIFITIFMKLLLPFSVLSFQVAGSSELSFSSVITGLFGFVILALTLHLHVVFLRCILLKPRIVGGLDDVLAAGLT